MTLTIAECAAKWTQANHGIIALVETGNARILFYNTQAPVNCLRPVRQSRQLTANGCIALTENAVITKWCNKCKRDLPADKFSKGITHSKRLADTCKLCMREYRYFHRRKQKKLVVEHYGGCCACCGEKNIEFLTVDHIGGNGRQHRKEIGSSEICTWLINNDYPEGFQILCNNCNASLGYYGYCPHNPDLKRKPAVWK